MSIFETRLILLGYDVSVATRPKRFSIFWMTTSKSITKATGHLSDCSCTRPGSKSRDTSTVMKSNKVHSVDSPCFGFFCCCFFLHDLIGSAQVFELALFIRRRLLHHHQRVDPMDQEPEDDRHSTVSLRRAAPTCSVRQSGLRLQTGQDAFLYGALHEHLQPPMSTLLPVVWKYRRIPAAHSMDPLNQGTRLSLVKE